MAEFTVIGSASVGMDNMGWERIIGLGGTASAGPAIKFSDTKGKVTILGVQSYASGGFTFVMPAASGEAGVKPTLGVDNVLRSKNSAAGLDSTYGIRMFPLWGYRASDRGPREVVGMGVEMTETYKCEGSGCDDLHSGGDGQMTLNIQMTVERGDWDRVLFLMGAGIFWN
ncbi:MAG: hypothetical protein HY542_04655 [Deltaproteobacteria bacterium]|nr:hypothetical protein [Deltaproteobacteria bacterium]